MALPVGSRKNRCSRPSNSTADGPALVFDPEYQLAGRAHPRIPSGETTCMTPLPPWSWKKRWHRSWNQAMPGGAPPLVL
jgi:hypothetical protein